MTYKIMATTSLQALKGDKFGFWNLAVPLKNAASVSSVRIWLTGGLLVTPNYFVGIGIAVHLACIL